MPPLPGDAPSADRRPWLFPLTYLAHIAEEYAAGEGFPAWLSRVAGVELSVGRFLGLNAVFWAAMVLAAWAAARRPGRSWVTAGLGTTVLVNSCLHLGGTLVTGSYSPGTVSAGLLWVPLGAWAVLRARRDGGWAALRLGIPAGLAAHAVVSALALGAGR